jgi:hypothetical protein
MKITKQRLKEIIREELSHTNEGGLAGHYTEPRHEGGTPEERLLNKLLIMSKVGDAPDAGAAAEMLGLGEDEEVVAYLDSLMGSQMYRENRLKNEVASPSSTSRRAVDSRRRARDRKREDNPTYQKVKAASEKHIEKAKKGK